MLSLSVEVSLHIAYNQYSNSNKGVGFMKILNRLSELTSIDSKYWVLIFKTLVFWIVLDVIKRIII